MKIILVQSRIWLFSLGMATLFFSCKPDYEKKLAALDQEMAASNGVITDKTKANEFIETAEKYAVAVQSSDPDKYVDLILKAAGLAKTIESPSKAIQLYSSISEKMPKHPKAPMALFMTGFIYENDLNDLPRAKQTYEAFLARYPQDPDFVDDAQSALKMLGKSPEEIVKGFEQQNKTQDSLEKKNQ